jgi:ribonuclease D
MSAGQDSLQPTRSGRQPRYRYRARSDAQAHSESSLGPQEQDRDHPLACRDQPRLIARQDELDQLLADLRAAGSFAFDSEFIGELTYLPRLCLIQTASTTQIALVDALADLDLRPFWELVADPAVEKIVHAGQQDVEPVFRALGKAPANLFDTQISAAFVGLGYPLSLSKLIYAVIGAKLSKGLTFTHWDRRPLSEHQLRYAASDVRYLPAARHEMGRRLQELGHAAWAAEESATLADAALYEFNAETHWMKIRGMGALAPRNQAILRQLTIWRDQAARQENVPPRTLLKDEILLSLARSPIQSVADLARVRGLPRPVEAVHGDAIVAATRLAKDMPAERLPALSNQEPTPREKFSADGLFFAMQCLCAGRQIDPALVASHQEVAELYRLLAAGESPQNLRLLRGWRRQAAGEQLLALFHEKFHFSVGWNQGCLRADVGL